MFSRALLALTLIATTTIGHAVQKAGQVVRWVDENGITQFTDPSFAPTAEVVQIPRTNGMDVPKDISGDRSARPNFVKIAKAPKKNKRGWRGHEGRRGSNSRGRARRR